NVPVACGGVTVMPGDIVIADDDGAVVVPVALAPQLAQKASEHHEWEEFSRLKLSEGGDLRKYYPLSAEGRAEYEQWRKAQRRRAGGDSAGSSWRRGCASAGRSSCPRRSCGRPIRARTASGRSPTTRSSSPTSTCSRPRPTSRPGRSTGPTTRSSATDCRTRP